VVVSSIPSAQRHFSFPLCLWRKCVSYRIFHTSVTYSDGGHELSVNKSTLWHTEQQNTECSHLNLESLWEVLSPHHHVWWSHGADQEQLKPPILRSWPDYGVDSIMWRWKPEVHFHVTHGQCVHCVHTGADWTFIPNVESGWKYWTCMAGSFRGTGGSMLIF
jgi:hypothetical protein